MADGNAIKPEILEKLKEQLKNDYVRHLLPLLGNDQADKKETKQVSRAFSAFVLSKKFNINEKEASRYVIDDYGDNGIDAFYYHEKKSTLYLLQSKFIKKSIEQSEVLKFTQGVELLVRKEFESFNQNFKMLEDEFEAALNECESIVLALAYIGEGISGAARTTLSSKIDSLKREDERVQSKFKKFTGKQAEKYLTEKFSPERISKKITVYNYSKLQQSESIVLGTMKVSDLVELHLEYGNALYDKNIRYFIGAGKKGVNTSIKSTLSSDPEKFIFLNNGITAIGETIKPGPNVRNIDAKDITVNGLSIVNGAQTIASAAQYLDSEELRNSCNAMVTVTLIEAGDDLDLHKKITRARNLQNPVELSDFVALDDTQERLRLEIKLQGYEYYYRPQQIIGDAITVYVVAKALACLSNHIAYVAQLKTSSRPFEDIESKEYQTIFPSDVSAVTIINVYHFFIKIKELLLNAEKTTESPEKLVYRHCFFSLSFIILKYFSKIIHKEILSIDFIDKILSQPFDEIRQAHYDSFPKHESPHAFFKKQLEVSNLINKTIIRYLSLSNDEAIKALKTKTWSNEYGDEKMTRYLLGKLSKNGAQS